MQRPQQYDTLISESSSNLSGGQKQRISVARALLKNTSIIIFDEVTSSLDNISQDAVLDMIKRKASKATIIMIDHRYSHITEDSYIIYIEDRYTVLQGSHKELLNDNASYKTLFRKSE